MTTCLSRPITQADFSYRHHSRRAAEPPSFLGLQVRSRLYPGLRDGLHGRPPRGPFGVGRRGPTRRQGARHCSEDKGEMSNEHAPLCNPGTEIEICGQTKNSGRYPSGCDDDCAMPSFLVK